MSDIGDLLDGYVSGEELAKALKVSRRTLKRYENEPNGLPSLTVGGRKIYKLESVRRWLEQRERKPNRRRTAA